MFCHKNERFSLFLADERLCFSGALTGATVWGCLTPTLRATPGTCAGLRLSRTLCDVASRRDSVAGQQHPPPDHAIFCYNNSCPHSHQPPLSAKVMLSLIFISTHHFADVGKMARNTLPFFMEA